MAFSSTKKFAEICSTAKQIVIICASYVQPLQHNTGMQQTDGQDTALSICRAIQSVVQVKGNRCIKQLLVKKVKGGPYPVERRWVLIYRTLAFEPVGG